MASTQRTVPAAGSAVVQLPAQRGVEPWSAPVRCPCGRERPVPHRVSPVGPVGRPGARRRDPVRPGGRPPRTEAGRRRSPRAWRVLAGARRPHLGRGASGATGRRARPAPADPSWAPGPLRAVHRHRAVDRGRRPSAWSWRSPTACSSPGPPPSWCRPVTRCGRSPATSRRSEDRRAVVDAIVDINGLHDVDLVPGMVLELP